ncbi:AlpA family phage regulatory protein [Haliea sp.]|uniref:helix-turn-helix transcriptional regulator n=1 Tax=Haliea sp. TaxID=1932666 RepID=UPI003414C471
MKEVQAMLGGKSRSTIYRWISSGWLPRPIKIGANSIAWPEEVFLEWRNSLCKGGV